jgi:Mrp family chromosome partitioning ATPase
MHLLSEQLSADPSRIIIYDMPPILAADDLLAFKDNTDAILFVVSEGVTSRMDALRARELMEDLNVVGTVLNRSDEKTASYY